MSRRRQWKLFVLLTAVLVVVILCLLVGKMEARKEFVSKLVGGYRMRFTLSTDWKPLPASANANDYEFSMSPSPIREWMEAHLFHWPPSSRKSAVWQTALRAGVETTKAAGPFITIRGGYPEPDVGMSNRIGAERHFWIDGCPATLVHCKFALHHNTNIHGIYLCVCSPDWSYTYIVQHLADRQDSDQADREMDALTSSFRMERVVGSTSDKR